MANEAGGLGRSLPARWSLLFPAPGHDRASAVRSRSSGTCNATSWSARGWYTPDEYREGLALAQLAPGPLAAQLAMYLGWARGGAVTAGLVGLAFVLPSFLMVLAIGVGYVRFGGLPGCRARSTASAPPSSRSSSAAWRS